VPRSPRLFRASEEIEPYRWVIVTLLALGVLVNYFDRVNLSVSHSALVASFGISPILFGQLSAAYSWTYAACQMPTGVLLDKFGVRKMSLWSIAIWGLASVAAAIAPGILLFFAARLLLGVGEAPTFPANAKAVGLWFPKEERSFATAIYDSSAKLANALGVPILGFLILRIGWRLSFGVTGLLSFGYLGLFALLYRDPSRFSVRNVMRREEALDAPTPLEQAQPLTLARLLREPKVIGLAIGFGAYNYVFYLLLTWLPTYISESLHISLMKSFLFTGAPWLLAAASELLIGGLLVDGLIQRGWDANRVRRTVLIGGTCCGLALFITAGAHTLAMALIPIAIANSGLAAAASVGWSLPAMLVPDSSTGRVCGIVNFANQISAIAAPILTGIIVERTHHYKWVFGIAAIYLVVGIAAYVFLLGRIEPIPLQER
jgi:ACS family D-galactonate transporter-like MFS transporter